MTFINPARIMSMLAQERGNVLEKLTFLVGLNHSPARLKTLLAELIAPEAFSFFLFLFYFIF